MSLKLALHIITGSCMLCNKPIVMFMGHCYTIHPDYLSWGIKRQKKALKELLFAIIIQAIDGRFTDDNGQLANPIVRDSLTNKGPITSAEVEKFLGVELRALDD